NLSACPANQIGEITTNLKSFAPAGSPTFDLHFDDAPTIYVNGQPSRTDPPVRKLERDLGGASAIDPYQGAATVPATPRPADPVDRSRRRAADDERRARPRRRLRERRPRHHRGALEQGAAERAERAFQADRSARCDVQGDQRSVREVRARHARRLDDGPQGAG